MIITLPGLFDIGTHRRLVTLCIYVKARAGKTGLTFTPEQYAKFDEWIGLDFTVFHATVTE
jgi:hypothetical protein